MDASRSSGDSRAPLSGVRILSWIFPCLLASVGTAQTSDISGTVADPTGAAIPGIVVTLNGREAATNAEGEFRFTNVKPGAYDLSIQQAPFKPVTRKLEVKTPPFAPVQITLELAEVRNEVTVTDSVSDVSTSPSENLSSMTVSSEDLKSLPVLGSDYMSVIEEMIGGAGSDPGGTTVVVDGVEMDARSVPIEAIQQLRINRDPYTAEFARPGRGRVEITTRDASQDFHGSINLAIRNSVLDARNAFAPERPDENRGLFTGYLSGPLDRSGKTSFMIAAERQDENLQSLVYAQTPTGLLNLQARAPQQSSDYMIKIRRLIGDKHVVTLRFDREHESAGNQGIGGSRLPEVAFTERQAENSWTLQHTSFLSASLISDLSLQYESSISSSESVFPGVRTISVSDAFVSGGAQVSQRRSEKELGLKYVLSWSKGKHLLRAGVDVPDWNWQTYQDLGNRQGTYQFASLADLAAGRPFAFTQQLGDPRVSFRQRRFGFFVQDNIKVRPGLSVGLGLRYDRQNFVTDGNNFAPRISIAWSPGNSRRTVLRGGFGIFYANLNSGVQRDVLLFGSGAFRRLIITNPTYPEPILDTPGQSLPPAAIVRAAGDLRSPYTAHFTLALEHKLTDRVTASATYTRFNGVSLFRSRDVNAPLAPTGERPDPLYGVIRQVESSGLLKSRSLELALSGRLTSFFTGSVRYELGKVMSNVDSIDALPANSYNIDSEWSRSVRDRRHSFRALGTFDVRRWFQTGFMLIAGSGAPYSLTTGRDENLDGFNNDRPLGISRNTLQGPGNLRLNLRLSKEIPLSSGNGDGPRLSLTADAFNVLNRVNYQGYVGNLSSPFFGLPVSASPARRMQLGVRFTF